MWSAEVTEDNSRIFSIPLRLLFFSTHFRTVGVSVLLTVAPASILSEKEGTYSPIPLFPNILVLTYYSS